MIPIGGFRVIEHQSFTELTHQYFPDLERSPDGRPSHNDFIVLDLEPTKRFFSNRFFDLPELHPGRPDYRVRTFRGQVAPLIQITGQLLPNGQIIELLILEVDHNPPEAFFRSSYR